MRQSALEQGESFAFETVISHLSKIDVLRHAKEKGYETRLLFISTFDPEINKARVEDRVVKGGHSVPEDKIEPRYRRTMSYLSLALKYSDKARFYDNSLDAPVMIYEHSPKIGKKFYPQPPDSKWNLEEIYKYTEISKKIASEYQAHVAKECT